MPDPIALDAWRSGVRIAPLLPGAEHHAIHAYFTMCPESPDGSRVVFYASTAEDAGSGEIRVLERRDGSVRTLARIAAVEDAHRAACQQWADGGRSIAYHDCRDGRWQVAATDLATGRERVLAADRLLGFGAAADPRVPLYGRHWNPGPHRDLELADVRSGAIATAVRVADVVAAYRDWVLAEFGGEDISIAFPAISPDSSKVFLKPARGRGGDDVRGMDASKREGMIVCDLATGKPLRRFDRWGHPSWAPDSQGIFEKGNILIRIADGSTRTHIPGSHSDHPSLSPDGRLFVTDGVVARHPDGKAREWGIIVGSTERDECVIIDRFANDQGARSWRRSHPHPVFSADGRRIYYNVSRDRWTRLHVAEAAAG